MTKATCTLILIVIVGCGSCWSGERRAVHPSRVGPEMGGEAKLCERIGQRYRPRGAWSERHLGTDFNVCENEPVVAIADGEVSSVMAGDDSTRGSFVVIYHRRSDGSFVGARYAHLKSVTLRQGDRVTRGQSLGPVWTPTAASERATWSPHIHLSIINAGVPIEQLDPLQLVWDCISVTDEFHWVYPVRC